MMHKTSQALSLRLAVKAALVSAVVSQTALADRVFVDIQAAPIDECLAQLAEQTRTLISADADHAKHARCQAVQGQMPVQDILENLLAGTGLVAQQKDSSRYVLVPADSLPQLPTREIAGLERLEVVGNSVSRISSGATGLDLSAKDTPQTLSLIDLDFIQDFNLSNIEEVMEQSTGVYRYKWGFSDRTEFMSRGYGINAFVKDGMPSAIGGTQEHRLDSVVYERIEVLRGASGFMEGVGEPSATLNLIAKKANRDSRVNMAAELGSWAHYRGELDATGALSDSGALAGRVVLAYQDNESHVDFQNSNKLVAYTNLHAHLGEQTEASLSLHWQDNALNLNGWGLPIFFSDGSALHVNKKTNLTSPHAMNDNEYQGYQFRLTHLLNADWQLDFVAQHTKTRLDYVQTQFRGQPDRQTGLGLIASDLAGYEDVKGHSLSLALKGQFYWFEREHKLNLAYLRSDYTHNQGNLDQLVDGKFAPYEPFGSIFERQLIDFAAPEFHLTRILTTDIKEQSLSLSAQINLTDQLRSVVGFKGYKFDNLGRTWMPTAVTETPNDASGTSYYLGLVYDITDAISGYASYTDVYQPQLNRVDIDLKPLDAVTGVNLEAGVKGEFFDERLSINLSLFDMQKKNVAEVLEDYVDTTPMRFRQIDGAQSDGFEFEVNGHLTDNWQLVLGYSQFSLEDQEGEDINRGSPRKLFNLHNRYQWQDWLFGLGVNWTDDSYVSVFAVPGFEHGLPPGYRRGTVLDRKPGQTLVSASAKYQVSDNLSLQLNITNLLDKTYFDTYGPVPKWYSQPRAFKLGVTYNF